MQNASATLPRGFKASAWPDLDPTARQLLLEEFLIANPDLELTGAIDFEASLEPLLRDSRDGRIVSLAGEVIFAGDVGGLQVPVMPGGFTFPTLTRGQVDSLILAFAVALAVGAVIVVFDR